MVAQVMSDVDCFMAARELGTPIALCEGYSRFEHVILAAMSGAINHTKLAQLSETEIEVLEEAVWKHHTHQVEANKCTSVLMQLVKAPVDVVWSIVRRFDMPQTYKRFIKSCVMKGDLKVGSVRDITVVSGLPASHSTERLEALDEDNHIYGFSVICGEHRLQNYRSTTTLHEVEIDNMKQTLVFESYLVDIPEGNTKDDTCLFADTVVRCNLQSLARLAERLSAKAAKVKSDGMTIMF